MTIKDEYNKFLTRFRRASKWLDDPARTPEEIEKWMPEFQGIIKHLGELLVKMQKSGIKYTQDEVLNGFKIS